MTLAGALVLWAIRRDDGPDLLTLTEAGMIGKIGVNASGFAMCVNLLTSDLDTGQAAVPMHIILRRVLEAAHSVEEAIALIGPARRQTSCNHLIADRGGHLADVEATPFGIQVLWPTHGVRPTPTIVWRLRLPRMIALFATSRRRWHAAGAPPCWQRSRQLTKPDCAASSVTMPLPPIRSACTSRRNCHLINKTSLSLHSFLI